MYRYIISYDQHRDKDYTPIWTLLRSWGWNQTPELLPSYIRNKFPKVNRSLFAARRLFRRLQLARALALGGSDPFAVKFVLRDDVSLTAKEPHIDQRHVRSREEALGALPLAF